MTISEGNVIITGTATEDWEDFISFRVVATALEPSKVPDGYDVIQSYTLAIEPKVDPSVFRDTSDIRLVTVWLFGIMTGLFFLTAVIAICCGCFGKCQGANSKDGVNGVR